MAMSPSQARVIDPILTNHSRGYTQAGFIGDGMLPIADMPTRAAKRIEFGREAFRRYKIQRAPGAAIAQVSFGYEGKSVSLSQYALGAKTPIEHQEEADEVPGIDLLTTSVDLVLAVIALEREIQQAQKVRDSSLYSATNKIALGAGAKWSDPGSVPFNDVEAGREVIRKRTGRRPTKMAIGAPVASSLKKHPDVQKRFTHVTSDAISNEMLRQYFDIPELLIGDAIYDDDAGNPNDVWGNDAVLAYVPPAAQANINLPAFGYTYRLRGHPFVQPAHYERSVRSWMNDVFDEWSPEVVGADAGYLIQAAV